MNTSDTPEPVEPSNPSEPISDTPPPASPTPVQPAAQFFDGIRSWGAVRPQGRSGPGVAAALAGKFNLGAGFVRLLFVLAFFIAGLGLVAYGIGWLLLPQEEDSKIHLQELFAGRFDAAQLGAGLLVLAGLNNNGGHIITWPFWLIALIALAVFMRRWWMWLIIVILSALLALGLLFNLSTSNGFYWHSAQETVRPQENAAVSERYSLGSGDQTLDLSDVNFTNSRTIDVELAAGNLDVILPADVNVQADMHVNVGRIDWSLPGNSGEVSGINLDRSVSSTNMDDAKQLTVRINVRAGNLQVTQESN